MAPIAIDSSPVTVISHEDGIPSIDKIKATNGKLKELDCYPSSFYSNYLSIHAKNRLPSPIRGLLPIESQPNMISMLAGKPNPSLFPITSLSVTVRSPVTGEETVLPITGKTLDEALQYGPTGGQAPVVQWFKGLQELSHHRAQTSDWDLTIGSGSQDLLYKALLSLLNPGDPILVEAPTYAGVVPLLLGQQADCIEIEADADGVCTSSMRKVLENWPSNKPRPKVFYTVPYGGNPSGVTATLERRLEVLALAHEYDFLILEDDPYYYLYFGSAPRPASYWELEAQAQFDKPRGRVLRFDSFSKVLSSGIRIGLATGPKALIDAINLHTSSSNLQVSSTTQAIVYALLANWGYDTFFAHTRLVADFYRQKRDVFAKALDVHLKGLAEWEMPEAGMFFWIKMYLPTSSAAPEGDSESVIREKALEAGILALPGKSFYTVNRATPYVRCAFSLLDEVDVNEGLRRLAEVIRSCH